LLPIHARYLEETSIFGRQPDEFVEKHNEVLRLTLERVHRINGLLAARDELVKGRGDYRSITAELSQRDQAHGAHHP
jgi:hypothetical protein